MQMYHTPYEAVMRSIELIAKEVKPKLKEPAARSVGRGRYGVPGQPVIGGGGVPWLSGNAPWRACG
jgi:hypothetical protein